MAAGLCILEQLKLTVTMFIMMKQHVSQYNSVAHWRVFHSFWTIELEFGVTKKNKEHHQFYPLINKSLLNSIRAEK